MQVTELGLPGVKLIVPTYFDDNRGYSTEAYNNRTLQEYRITTKFVVQPVEKAQPSLDFFDKPRKRCTGRFPFDGRGHWDHTFFRQASIYKNSTATVGGHRAVNSARHSPVHGVAALGRLISQYLDDRRIAEITRICTNCILYTAAIFFMSDAPVSPEK